MSYEIPMNGPSRDFIKCFTAAGNHLNYHGNKSIHRFGWIRAHPYPPYLEHLSFMLGNQFFLVRIEDVHGRTQIPGNRNGLIRKARECRAHACIMPMSDNPSIFPNVCDYMSMDELMKVKWTPIEPEWGLIDAETGVRVDPPELVTNEEIELTDWELLEFGVECIRMKLEDEQGRKIMSFQSDPELLPNLWFVGDDGPEWVIVRAVRWPRELAELPSDWRTRMAHAAKLSRRGNFASVSFASDDTRSSGKILRNSEADFEFPGFERLEL